MKIKLQREINDKKQTDKMDPLWEGNRICSILEHLKWLDEVDKRLAKEREKRSEKDDQN